MQVFQNVLLQATNLAFFKTEIQVKCEIIKSNSFDMLQVSVEYKGREMSTLIDENQDALFS